MKFLHRGEEYVRISHMMNGTYDAVRVRDGKLVTFGNTIKVEVRGA